MQLASAPQVDFDIVVRHASLRYGGTFLFQDLDFVLPAGCWTCLLGPSGVGKSSLLRVIAGLAPLDGGGVVCTDGRPLAGRLAWMSQRDDLLPWLSVEGNVTLGARLRGESSIAPRRRTCWRGSASSPSRSSCPRRSRAASGSAPRLPARCWRIARWC